MVCGVTSLGFDHVGLLGDTLEKIAWQKGGICKPGHPSYIIPQPEGPLKVLAERAKELKVHMYQLFQWHSSIFNTVHVVGVTGIKYRSCSSSFGLSRR